MKTLQIGE